MSDLNLLKEAAHVDAVAFHIQALLQDIVAIAKRKLPYPEAHLNLLLEGVLSRAFPKSSCTACR